MKGQESSSNNNNNRRPFSQSINNEESTTHESEQQSSKTVQVEGSFSASDRHHYYFDNHGPICQSYNATKNPLITSSRGPCDDWMGYGRRETFDVCTPSQNFFQQFLRGSPPDGDGGSLQCHYNPMTKATFCEAHNLRVNTSKIQVARGGEPIFSVKGRKEGDEFPKYSKGAFQLSHCDMVMNGMESGSGTDEFQAKKRANEKLPHHLLGMMENLEVVAGESSLASTNEQDKCTRLEKRPTLFVTRYEYANLYHTMTDYYNAYQAAMVVTKGNAVKMDRVNLVFFDGHAKGTLDVGWELLFPNADISYVSELPSLTCFRHAIFVSPGYRSPISIASLINLGINPLPQTFLPTCGTSEWQVDFRERFLYGSKCRLRLYKGWMHPYHAHNDNQKRSASSIQTVRVLLLLRKNHYSHPRMDGATSRQIKNEANVEAAIQNVSDQVQNGRYGPVKIDARRLILEQHDLSEQILMVQQADIIVGMHGAGLSHILWARPGTLLLELKPPSFTGHGHFEPLTQLAGGLYEPFFDVDIAPQNNPLVHRVSIGSFSETIRQAVEQFVNHHLNNGS